MSQKVRQWPVLFDAQASRYEENGFTKHTAKEIDFLLALFPISPGARFLDIGCGTGRHSIELAKRGYQVTGLDISAGMLKVAREKAKEAGVEVNWVQADALDFKFEESFDAALCVCEGAVGLIEHGEDAEAHDRAIFRNIAAVLKPNAPFLLTALNGYSTIRQMNDQQVIQGRFNPATMVSHYVDEWQLPDGVAHVTIYERLFIPPELVRLLRDSGFTVDNVFGGTAGHWGQRPVSLDEVEAMFVCRRSA